MKVFCTALAFGALLLTGAPSRAQDLTAQKVTETSNLRALALADTPGSKSYIQAVLTVATFYTEHALYPEAREILKAAVERQTREAVTAYEIAPILVRLSDVDKELKLWSEQAETFGSLVSVWSPAEGAQSSIVAHFLLQQAGAYRRSAQYEDAKAASKKAADILTALQAPYTAAAQRLSRQRNRDVNSAPVKQFPPIVPVDGNYHVGLGVSTPKLLEKVEPEYSDRARRARYQGTVVMKVVVSAKGSEDDMQVVSPLGLGLDENAIEAVKKWKFQPGEKNGEPVAVIANIEVNFHLL